LTSQGEGDHEELKARLAELERKTGRAGNLEFKVGAKGSVSVYGLGGFLVTLDYDSGCDWWTLSKTCGRSSKRTMTSSG